MSLDFELNEQGDGCFSLYGELSFATVAAVAERCQPHLWQTDEVLLDLTGVTRTDSAGLALLIGWMRLARQQKKRIVFKNIPEQMMVIASVVGVDRLLPTE